MRSRLPSFARATSIVLVVAALLAGTTSSGGALAAPSAPAAGPAFTTPPSYAVPEAATYTFGLQPLADVMAAAAAQAQCGLTQNELATMVLAPTYPETGAANALSPSPMTLSRYDTSSGLYAFGNPATPYPRAFWHPGIGAWQFDSAGGWHLSAAQEMSTDTAASTAAQVIATRWCNDTADAANPVARRANAWAPWNGCGVAGATCEAIYQTIYSPGTLNVATDPSVTRTGGMVTRTCQISGSLPVTCSRVDPALAQGDAAFAAPGFGPSPVTAPFYDFVIGSTEYHVWLKDDTGYRGHHRGHAPDRQQRPHLADLVERRPDVRRVGQRRRVWSRALRPQLEHHRRGRRVLRHRRTAWRHGDGLRLGRQRHGHRRRVRQRHLVHHQLDGRWRAPAGVRVRRSGGHPGVR